ncbi:MAG: T9SS type A sorting domain-containing protein [bacterium]|nr:T9SS type A sorting domain-containing protein [bacterium]
MLKNITLTVLCLFGLNMTIKAQVTFDEDTLFTDGYVAATASDYAELIAETKIHNKGSLPDTIIWYRNVNNLPSVNWTSAVCDVIQCYDVTTNSAEFIIDAGVIRTLSFHFYPKIDNGKGQMVVRFAKKSNQTIYTDIYINVQGYGLNIKTLKKADFSLFPNPAKENLVINSNSANSGQFTIVNLLGETILSGAFENGKPIDTSSLTTGIYCVNVIDGTSVTSSKLVIQ